MDFVKTLADQEKVQFMLGSHGCIHIIGNPRSGTTYVYDVLTSYHLNYNGYILETDEPFGYLYGISEEDTQRKARYTNKLEKFSTMSKSVIKSHVWHFNDLQKWGLMEKLKAVTDYNIIMIRRDLFNLALSLSISTVTNQWAKYKKSDQIYIDPDMFKMHLLGQMHEQIKLLENPWEFKYNEIVFYEDLENWPRNTISNMRISGNSTVNDFRKVKTLISRAPDKKDIVLNYNELWDTGLEYINAKKEEFGYNFTRGYFELDDYTMKNVKVQLTL